MKFYNAKTGASTEKNNFNLLKKENGIALLSREIQLENGSNVRQLKVEYIAETNSSKVVELIRNEASAKTWMKGVEDLKILKRADEYNWITYMEYNLPWPFQNQDCILNYTMQSTGPVQVIHFKCNPSYKPVYTGIERIQHMEGTWKIISISDKKCKVEYQIHTEQKAKFPRWVQDPVVHENLLSSMKAMKGMLQ